MKLFSCITLILFFGIVYLKAANPEYLGNLAVALQSNNIDFKLNMLQKAIEVDPDNSRTACQEMLRILDKTAPNTPKTAQFLSLWQKYPDSEPITEFGVICSLRQGVEISLISEKLNNSIFLISKKSNWDSATFPKLVELGIFLNLRTQKYEFCKKLFDTTYPLLDNTQQVRLLGTILECYGIIAFRHELISMKSINWKELPKSLWIKEYEKILAMLEERQKNFGGQELQQIVQKYHRLGIKWALTLAKKHAKRTISKEWITLWVEIATVMGTPQELNEALEYSSESIESQRIRRFHNYLNNRDFAAAKVELDCISIPVMKQRLKIILYATQPDYMELKKLTKELISNGLASADLIFPLLLIAEQTMDKEALAQAFALAKETKSVNDANSFGYVSTVLGVNMQEAYQLINRAVKSDPENPAYLDSMAYWHYKMKNYPEAQKWMDKALKHIQPSFEIGTLLFHAGEIALALNQNERAKKYFLLALKNQDVDPQLDVKAVKLVLEALKDK